MITTIQIETDKVLVPMTSHEYLAYTDFLENRIKGTKFIGYFSGLSLYYNKLQENEIVDELVEKCVILQRQRTKCYLMLSDKQRKELGFAI